MKTAIVALFVFLVVSQSEALRCKCGGLRRCSGPVETCGGLSDVCASVIISAGSVTNYFKGCMKSGDCILMNRPGVSSSFCCSSDECNR